MDELVLAIAEGGPTAEIKAQARAVLRARMAEAGAAENACAVERLAARLHALDTPARFQRGNIPEPIGFREEGAA